VSQVFLGGRYGCLTSPWAVERMVSSMTTRLATRSGHVSSESLLLSCCTAIIDVPMIAVLHDDTAELQERFLGAQSP